jgi:hypothetical protein
MPTDFRRDVLARIVHEADLRLATPDLDDLDESPLSRMAPPVRRVEDGDVAGAKVAMRGLEVDHLAVVPPVTSGTWSVALRGLRSLA